MVGGGRPSTSLCASAKETRGSSPFGEDDEKPKDRFPRSRE
jgi:hypothetical protein